MKTITETIHKDAILSECGKYRYSLRRRWEPELPQVLFIGLNPSTADAQKDDPTVKKLIDYTHKWGYGGFAILNLFAYRATDQKDLQGLDSRTLIGPRNETFLKEARVKYKPVIFMWGNGVEDLPIACWAWRERVINLFPGAMCFQQNRGGEPAHPLYLGSHLRPIKYVHP